MQEKENILNIYEETSYNFFRKKQDYLKISPTSGSAINLNSSGGQITHEVNSTESYIFMPEAYGVLTYSITKADNTDLGDANITLEHNWPMRIFSQLIVDIGGFQKTYTNPGEYDTILKTIMYSKLMNETGEEYGWIPDTGSGSYVEDIPLAILGNGETAATENKTTKGQYNKIVKRLNSRNINTGYIKRRENYNKVTTAPKRGGVIKLSLSPLIGFLDWQKITKGIPFKFHWTRKNNDKEIFFGASGLNPKLTIESFEIMIPTISLSPSAEAAFLKSLDKDITVSYIERETISPIRIESSVYTWNIANISNMPHAVFVVFKHNANLPSLRENNSKFISSLSQQAEVAEVAPDSAIPARQEVIIKELQLRLNQVHYPNDRIRINATKQDFNKAHKMYEDICVRFGVLPSLSKQDFQTLYPIFCFDLTAQDEHLVKTGVNIQLDIEKSSNEPLTAYALILVQTKKVIRVNSGNQMSRVE